MLEGHHFDIRMKIIRKRMSGSINNNKQNLEGMLFSKQYLHFTDTAAQKGFSEEDLGHHDLLFLVDIAVCAH